MLTPPWHFAVGIAGRAEPKTGKRRRYRARTGVAPNAAGARQPDAAIASMGCECAILRTHKGSDCRLGHFRRAQRGLRRRYLRQHAQGGRLRWAGDPRNWTGWRLRYLCWPAVWSGIQRQCRLEKDTRRSVAKEGWRPSRPLPDDVTPGDSSSNRRGGEGAGGRQPHRATDPPDEVFRRFEENGRA